MTSPTPSGATRIEALAEHLQRPVGEDDRRRARRHLLDWLACVVGARRSEVGMSQHAMVGEPAMLRAAMLGNVLEMDDVHRAAILHPGPVVWSTVLNAGGSEMTPLIDAAVRGYEATIAIGATFDAAHYRYWHNTTTAGVFGAAAAAASLAGLDADRTADALGLAGSVTGGLWQLRHEPVTAKQWHIAHAVRTGQSASDSAAAGITGPRQILEGPQGIYAATCRVPRPLVLGQGWRMAEVSFKPWGACRHAHPAIDAALELKAIGALDGPITIHAYADAIAFCDRPEPRTSIEAKFSLQHAIAIVRGRGVPRLADFEPDAIAALAPLRGGITIVADDQLTARYPAHFGVRITAGSHLVTRDDTLGDPERPIDDAGLIAKARELFAWGGLDDADADRGIALALEGDDPNALVAWIEAAL